MGQFFDDQEDTWFDGGREWYQKQNDLTDKEMENIGGIPGDYNPDEALTTKAMRPSATLNAIIDAL